MMTIPLSLYIHIPWCVKKCPYCDFNSYATDKEIKEIPEEAYIQMLLRDLEQDLPLVWGRRIKSIFFGGGTPSLFSPNGIEKILSYVHALLPCDPQAEITLEANPGTFEHHAFKDYRNAGINRISLGAQSFQNDKLQALGRIHDADNIKRALELIHNSQFDNFNIDLMYGLPQQTVNDALYDLKTALTFSPTHLSWYNLTIEPNTIFHQKPPLLPNEDLTSEIQEEGQAYIAANEFTQYEISAYSKFTSKSIDPQKNFQCIHNKNYWEFGDYLGIGAGAHAKITHQGENTLTRYWKTRYPKSYLNPENPLIAGSKTLPPSDRVFEFMLNALRLTDGFPTTLFQERTLLPIDCIQAILNEAKDKDLLNITSKKITPTKLGKRFLNNLIELFIPKNIK